MFVCDVSRNKCKFQMVQQDVTNGGGGGGRGGGGVYVCHDFMGCAVSLRRSTDARVICMLF